MEELKQQLPTDLSINLQQLAILLTVLDKEVHNTKYFKRMIPEGEEDQDNYYVENLVVLQHSFIRSMSDSSVGPFLEKNPHLEHLFHKLNPAPLEEHED